MGVIERIFCISVMTALMGWLVVIETDSGSWLWGLLSVAGTAGFTWWLTGQEPEKNGDE